MLFSGPRGPSLGGVRTYIVERYLLGVTAGQLEEASARLAAAAEELTMHGIAVRHTGSTFVPE